MVVLSHVLMTSCDTCTFCVYGTCSNPAPDDIITCSCTPGYTGQYCHLVDTNKIIITVGSNRALLNFEREVNMRDLRLTITPNNSKIYFSDYPPSIGIHNLKEITKYKVCIIPLFNSTDISADIMNTVDKTVSLPEIEPQTKCISLRTSQDYSKLYTLLARICAGFVGGSVLFLLVYQLLKLCCLNRELQFYNIAEADESLLEGTIYDILEKRLEMAEARQLYLYKVFRKGPAKNDSGSMVDDLKTRPVIVYFSKSNERRLVLQHARSSNKVQVDGTRILLPPGSGY